MGALRNIAVRIRIKTKEKQVRIITCVCKYIEILTESNRKQIEISSFIAMPMVPGFTSGV